MRAALPQRVWRALFAAGVALQLFILYTPKAPSAGEFGADKFIHAGMFGGVLWLGAMAAVPFWPLTGVLCVHAVVSECIQAWWIPGRDGDWRDVLADVTGVLIVTLLLRMHHRRAARPG